SFALRLLRNGHVVAALPVVPAETFASGTVRLLDVPVGPSQRTTLRVFGLENTASAVRIRTYSLPLLGFQMIGTALSDTTIFLTPSPYSYIPAFPLGPSYAGLRWSTLPGALDTPISIEVTADDGAHIWAYVTAVSNMTDQVLVITPR